MRAFYLPHRDTILQKITFHIDGREISRDDLRVFLDKRAARAPQI